MVNRTIQGNKELTEVKRDVDALNEVVFGGKNPQDSLVSLVHNTNKLIQEFVDNDKSNKKWIIGGILSSISLMVGCLITIGYKSAEFDRAISDINNINSRLVIIEQGKR